MVVSQRTIQEYFKLKTPTMEKKLVPLVIVENDPELKRLSDEIEVQGKIYKEKVKFIDKQRENARKETIGGVWDDIEDLLVARGLITEQEKQDNVSLSFNDGVLFKGKNNGIDGLLAGFLGLGPQS